MVILLQLRERLATIPLLLLTETHLRLKISKLVLGLGQQLLLLSSLELFLFNLSAQSLDLVFTFFDSLRKLDDLLLFHLNGGLALAHLFLELLSQILVILLQLRERLATVLLLLLT